MTTACDPLFGQGSANHFMAIHMSLIPKGSRRGHVLIWGEPYSEAAVLPGAQRQIQWSIVNPSSFEADNFCANLPTGESTNR